MGNVVKLLSRPSCFLLSYSILTFKVSFDLISKDQPAHPVPGSAYFAGP